MHIQIINANHHNIPLVSHLISTHHPTRALTPAHTSPPTRPTPLSPPLAPVHDVQDFVPDALPITSTPHTAQHQPHPLLSLTTRLAVRTRNRVRQALLLLWVQAGNSRHTGERQACRRHTKKCRTKTHRHSCLGNCDNNVESTSWVVKFGAGGRFLTRCHEAAHTTRFKGATCVGVHI